MRRLRIDRVRGQAMVLLALALVGLFGFAGLAIDGGMLYFERRRGQNAADNAALAAALKKAQSQSAAIVRSEALAVAAQGGYDNNATSNWVTVDENHTIGGQAKYVRVIIEQVVNTQFIHLVYSGPVRLTVEAVAFGDRPRPLLEGFAVASLNPGVCNGNDFSARGGTASIIRDAGLFINAKCSGSSINMEGSGARLGTSVSSLCPDPEQQSTCFIDARFNIVVAGTVSGSNTVPCPQVAGSPPNPEVDWWSPPPTSNCNFAPGPTQNAPQVDPDPMTVAGVPAKASTLDGNTVCTEPARSLGSTNPHELVPGHYVNLDVGSNQDLVLKPGIYCLTGMGTLINARTLSMGNVIDAQGKTVQGVLIYIQHKDGDFKWSGNGTFNTVALNEETCVAYSPACDFAGIAIFKPVGRNTCSNSDVEIEFAGNAQMIVKGLIYAPQSYLVYTGNGDLTMTGQSLVGCVRYAGNGTLDVTYDPKFTYVPPPAVKLVQ